MAENLRTTPLRLSPSEHRALLFLGDLVMSVASVFAALYTWRQYNVSVQYAALIAEGTPPARADLIVQNQVSIEVPLWFYLLPILWMLLLVELYEPHAAGSGRKTTRGIAIAAFVGLLAYSLAFLLRQNSDLPRVGVGAFLLFASLLTLGWRMLFIRIYKRTGQLRRMLVIGAGKAGQTLAELYASLATRSFNLVGFVDDDRQKLKKAFYGLNVLGTSERLLPLIDEHRITDLVVAINGEIQGATFQTILDAQEKGVEVTRMPILYEEMTGRLPIHHLESDWIIRSFVDEVHVSGFYELTKRVIDFLGGLIGMVVFLVLFPLISLAILLDSGLPIMYSQTRLGKGGKRFMIYKFRTMRRDAEMNGEAKLAEEKDPRVTRIGNFLRKTRLDEFPQFWNVLHGDMSLVGPRAERPELVASFQKQVPFYRARLLVKPGVSGWAQINYGYYASVTEMAVKLEYDLYYIKHRTLAMDFQIILRTIGTVMRRTGR
ncbi:MAG TPA: sugar transferase [Anaerolineales bacterium]|nr:sugar transferase [Anaerolineales bacterium]